MYKQFEEDVNIAVEGYLALNKEGRDATFKRIKASHEDPHQLNVEQDAWSKRQGY